MRILFVGDAVGQYASQKLAEFLPSYKLEQGIDVTIVNGENSANGNGITPFSANILLSAVDVITTGNHCFKRREMLNMFEDNERIIRPYNLGEELQGRGYTILDLGKYRLAVVNLMGNAFMLPCDNPFKEIEKLLPRIETDNVIVDFHAEATSEKKAMGYFLAGKVSAVLGTHTHVQTADEQIMSEHTAYISDVGMTGSNDSVIGAQKEGVIRRFCSYEPIRHMEADGVTQINAVILEIEPDSGKAISIERVQQDI